MTKEEFTNTYCVKCGSQRCSSALDDMAVACPHYILEFTRKDKKVKKMKRFKVKDGVTKEDLIALGFREGGTWIKQDAKLFVSKMLNNNISINIAFGDNIADWDDFINIDVLDEDWGQPYTPFYGDNYGKEISNFPYLENVIEKYNKVMSELGIFEEIKE